MRAYSWPARGPLTVPAPCSLTISADRLDGGRLQVLGRTDRHTERLLGSGVRRVDVETGGLQLTSEFKLPLAAGKGDVCDAVNVGRLLDALVEDGDSVAAEGPKEVTELEDDILSGTWE